MNRKKLISTARVFVILVVILIAFARPAYAAEPSKQVVKVAYFEIGDYYKEISDGVVDSYDTEKLNKIAKYSNLTFEYVNCGNWANAVAMLGRHEVDLVGTFQWTQEREEEYEFCLESYGFTVAELAASSGSKIAYENYDAIGKSVIGCMQSYVREKEMRQLFAEHGISPVIKYYPTQLEMEKALENGDVDIIASNSHTLKNSYVVLEKYAVAPYFFASWKGNTQLTDQIDNALINISIQEPDSDDELMMKYFPSIIGAPLTKEEHDLIAKNKTYDVYFNSDTRPTSWYDEKTGTMQGGLVEACKQITETTGLKLNPVPIFAGKTKLDGTAIKSTTVYEGADENLFAVPGETRALLDENFNLYFRDDKRIDLSKDDITVAIVANREHLRGYIENAYPNASIKEYENPVACLKAVERGEVELTYLDCRNADNAITEQGIDHVKEFPIEPQHQGIALLVPEENRDLLVSIINKGVEGIDRGAIADYYIQCSLDTTRPMTLETIAQDHFGWFVFAGALLGLVLIGFAVLYTYARVMKKQRDKIEKADADRTEFFGRMSHDMRTPMNGILGMIELSESADGLPAEVRANLHKAKAAGQYMLRLINDTLDLQRMESKKLQLEKNILNVTDFYNDIFSMMKVSAAQKDLEFNVKYVGIDLENYIEVDAVRVKQIFTNLISNAIKFTPNGGAVEVIVESVGEDANVLHRKFQVKDTGVGMSEDFIQNRLYQPYSQESNQLSMQLTGSGLGMAITKNLVETMGGRIEVQSELGEGTTFTVYLDLKRATKEQAEKAEQKKTAENKSTMFELSGKRILLCEDHPLNAEIAKKLLQKAGCVVEWAENGQLGVEKFAQSEVHGFDAILMDIRMPVMDGLEATKAIRKLAKADAATIPIIAMTANAYESDIQNCMDAGMNAHLAKPVAPAVLYSTLQSYI